MFFTTSWVSPSFSAFSSFLTFFTSLTPLYSHHTSPLTTPLTCTPVHLTSSKKIFPCPDPRPFHCSVLRYGTGTGYCTVAVCRHCQQRATLLPFYYRDRATGYRTRVPRAGTVAGRPIDLTVPSHHHTITSLRPTVGATTAP